MRFICYKQNNINSNSIIIKQQQQLNIGGFGTVCVGTHKLTNTKRAIKMVSKQTLTEQDKMILLEELSLLKSIDHPNILKILEHYEDDQHHFFVTELLTGGELFNKIVETKGFDENKASGYMRQILSAVSYCHTQNIVHRDLKPENILFTNKKNNQLKVIDFGCSTKFDRFKKIKDIVGTVLYLAPEVIKKDLYDEKCDIWSVGVVLYIMLCGYPPFDGENDEIIFDKIQNQSVSFTTQEWTNISDDAKDLIQKMLEKDPVKRISAQEAFQHRWIQKRIQHTQIHEGLMKNLASFSARNKVKTAILNMISLHILNNKEKQDIVQIFHQLDINGDGQLSKEELIEGYERLIGDRAQAEKIVKTVFKEIDYDGSGLVSFQEFLVATANKEKLLSQENLFIAFDLIDEDRNGFITKDELERVVGGTSINDQVWEQMMEDCDQNKDGKLDKNEFVDLLFKWLDRDLFKVKDEVLLADDRRSSKQMTPLNKQQLQQIGAFTPQQQYNNRYGYHGKIKTLEQFDQCFPQQKRLKENNNHSYNNIGHKTSLDAYAKGKYNKFQWNIYSSSKNKSKNMFSSQAAYQIKQTQPMSNSRGRSQKNLANSLQIQRINPNPLLNDSDSQQLIQQQIQQQQQDNNNSLQYNFDTSVSQQMNYFNNNNNNNKGDQNNSLSSIPGIVKSPTLNNQQNHKKLNTIQTIKTYYPSSTSSINN